MIKYHKAIKQYLIFNGEEFTTTEEHSKATLFTERDWRYWGESEFEREEIAQDEMMRLIDAPILPGIVPGK